MRAQAIIDSGHQIKKVTPRHYEVKSQSRPGLIYDVKRKRKAQWSCTCPDQLYHNSVCKHIMAVTASISGKEAAIMQLPVKKQAEPKKPDEPATVINIPQNIVHYCSVCGTKLSKNGHRYNGVQKYACPNKCSYPSFRGLLKWKHYDDDTILDVLDYTMKMSPTDMAAFLSRKKYRTSPQTIENWSMKIMKQLMKYAKRFKIKVGDIWHVDEVYIDINGVRKYLFLVMDAKTRFVLAAMIGDTKEGYNAARWQ